MTTIKAHQKMLRVSEAVGNVNYVSSDNVPYVTSEALLKNLGVFYKKNGEPDVNCVALVQAGLEKLRVIMTNGSLYCYKSGYYKRVNRRYIKKKLFKMLQEKLPLYWNATLDSMCYRLIPLMAKKVKLSEKGFVVNLANGIFDIRAGKFMKHSEEFLSTWKSPIKYNAEASCPEFLAFLNQIFQGDNESIILFQEIFGALICSHNLMEKFYVFYSPLEAGKSTVAEIISWIIGEKAISALSLDEISGRLGRAMLRGVQLNVAADSEIIGRKWNSGALKNIVGNDLVPVSKKGGSQAARIGAKILVLANNLWYSTDHTMSLLNKIVFLKFPSSIVEGEPKKANEIRLEPQY